MMVLSLVACGEATETNSGSESATTDTNTSNQSITSENSNEYVVGEAFGTDSVECVITELRWLTSEEFQSLSEEEVSGSNKILRLRTNTEFPNTNVWGQTGIQESSAAETSFVCVTYSLQNIGTEDIRSDLTNGDQGMLIPYGKIKVIYDDGYTFDCGEYSGFTTTLGVLRDAITEVGVIGFPNQVLENEDKPLKLEITLPNSSGETEAFYIIVR